MKSKTLFFLLLLSYLSLPAQQTGIGISAIFNNLNRETVVGVNKVNPKSENIIWDNLWQQRLNLSYFKTSNQDKRAWLFFLNAGLSKKSNELGTEFNYKKDSSTHTLYDATITRKIIEFGATYRTQLLQSKNEKLRFGLGYTAAVLNWRKETSPNSSVFFPRAFTKTGVDIRIEPYISYQITPRLYFDANIFRLFGLTTTIVKGFKDDPTIPIALRSQTYLDFDGQAVSFRNIGLQLGVRYALKTEKVKHKKKSKKK